VLLDLGTRPNQQPLDTHSGNTHNTAAGSPNRSGRFLKPVRPLLSYLASHRQGKPVRPVWQTGQADFLQKPPKNLSKRKLASRTSPPLNKNSHGMIETFLLKNSSRKPTGLNRSDRFGKPVRPALAWTVGKNSARGKTQNSKQSIFQFVPRIKVRLWDSWGTSWATFG
jgi:hypothetical protein